MIIGLCGAARSGKDTVADKLTEAFDAYTERIQISGPLKAYLRDMFDWTLEHTDGDLKDVPDKRYSRPCKQCFGRGEYMQNYGQDDETCGRCEGKGKIALTPRHAMQWLGGEFAEATFPAVYSTRAARQALKATTEGEFDLAVVTDIRFQRDIEAVKAVGGIIILVRREGDGLTGEAAAHKGEQARTKPEFLALVDHTIANDGTLDDLTSKVEALSLSLR